MRETIFFLTHDFKPIFRRTLSLVDSTPHDLKRVEVLLDDRFEPPSDLNLKSIKVVKCRRHHSSFDPIGQAHNFYLDRMLSDPSIMGESDNFWFVENDVYFHGNMMDFFEAHESFDADLLVPEFGLRNRDWCWLRSAKGLSVTPCGITAVIYRASKRLMLSVLDSIKDGTQAHMEVLLPHLCIRDGMSIRQFIPNTVSFCNTFGSPFSELVEADIVGGTSRYIQNKIYHPVKR